MSLDPATSRALPGERSDVAPPQWWQWPTILSLDAPTVAVTWQFLVGRVFDTVVVPAQAGVLALSVWLAYSADRWLEAGRLAPGMVRTQRHRQYQKHRKSTAALWAILLMLDVALAFHSLTPRELRAGFILLGAVVLYVLSHQWMHREKRGRVPKEFCVAALITTGVALFPAANTVQLHASAALIILLFFALCFANCAFISTWEWEVDISQGQISLARQFPGIHALVRRGTASLAGAALIIAWISPGNVRSSAVCLAMSALALLTVDWNEKSMGRRAARVLADVVLLTPIVPLLYS